MKISFAILYVRALCIIEKQNISENSERDLAKFYLSQVACTEPDNNDEYFNDFCYVLIYYFSQFL